MDIYQYPDFPASTDRPALVLGMPNDRYHSAPDQISKSGLDLISRSPAHYFYAAPRDTTRAMEIGTAIHTALLEPERFQKEYVLLKECKDRRQAEYKAAVAIHGSERVLVGHEADSVIGMVESVYAQPVARNWLSKKGYREASLFVRDPVTGVVVRCRYDLLTLDGEIVDLKKTQDARPDAFARSVLNYRYHVQDALYSDAWEWANGQRLSEFRIMAVEENMPHAAMVYKLDETARAEGRRLYREDLNTYAENLKSGEWPSYECTDNEIISLPDWKVRQIENDLEVNLGE